jgi:hypothetical protein
MTPSWAENRAGNRAKSREAIPEFPNFSLIIVIVWWGEKPFVKEKSINQTITENTFDAVSHVVRREYDCVFQRLKCLELECFRVKSKRFLVTPAQFSCNKFPCFNFYEKFFYRRIHQRMIYDNRFSVPGLEVDWVREWLQCMQRQMGKNARTSLYCFFLFQCRFVLHTLQSYHETLCDFIFTSFTAVFVLLLSVEMWNTVEHSTAYTLLLP